jgi:hypothetical protein
MPPDFQLRSEDLPQLKVWRRESMEFILASCAARRIQTVPAKPLPTSEGAFQVTLCCDRALADEVREEFNARPAWARQPRRLVG